MNNSSLQKSVESVVKAMAAVLSAGVPAQQVVEASVKEIQDSFKNSGVTPELIKDLQERGLTKDLTVQKLLDILGINVLDVGVRASTDQESHLSDTGISGSVDELPKEIKNMINRVSQIFGKDAEIHIAKLSRSDFENLIKPKSVDKKQKSEEPENDTSSKYCCAVHRIQSLLEQIAGIVEAGTPVTPDLYLAEDRAFAVDVIAEAVVNVSHLMTSMQGVSFYKIFAELHKFEVLCEMVDNLIVIDYEATRKAVIQMHSVRLELKNALVSHIVTTL